jgi:hypothetical protein
MSEEPQRRASLKEGTKWSKFRPISTNVELGDTLTPRSRKIDDLGKLIRSRCSPDFVE